MLANLDGRFGDQTEPDREVILREKSLPSESLSQILQSEPTQSILKIIS